VNVESLHVSARRASALLKAMGNPHRLMILGQLIQAERSVGELERIVGLSQSALSQHLARLRRDNLVKTRRSAQTIYYSLAGNEAAMVLATLYQLYCSERVVPANSEEYEREVEPVRHVARG
jgi:ArsR family transcriptional regulator, virulence genes transcriptional regulator